MPTHAEIIDELGGGTKVADALQGLGQRVDRETVYAWKGRNNIPAKYWPALVEISLRAGKPRRLEDFVAPLAAAPLGEGVRGETQDQDSAA